MRSSGSGIFSHARRLAAFSLPLALVLLLPGCLRQPAKLSLSAPLERHVAERGDPRLREALRSGSPLPFAVLARFDAPVFPHQAELLADAGIPPVESAGRSAILVASAKEVPGLFEQPAVKEIRYLCGQAALTRLHPAFEMEILRRFDSGDFAASLPVDLRFRSPPGERESQAVTDAGFRIRSQASDVWTVDGNLDSLPSLLAIEEIIYFETASN